MAATTGVTLLVLLLYCGQGAELPPINVTSGTTTTMNNTKVQQDMLGVFDEILVKEMLEPNRSSMSTLIQNSGTMSSTRLFKEKNAGIDESNQLSAAEGFHEFADVSPISLETEDKILNASAATNATDTAATNSPAEPSVDASYQTSGPEGYRDSQISSDTEDSLHSNAAAFTFGPRAHSQLMVYVMRGKKHPQTDQQLKQSVLDMILQNIGKSSGNSLQ